MAEAAVIVPAAPRSEVSRRLRTRLVAITGVLGGLTVVHDLDHLRQGRSLPPVLYGVAVAALVSIRARSQRDRELAKRIVSGGAPGLGKRK